eukprot:2404632-Pyramimonas_sp.AAC.1
MLVVTTTARTTAPFSATSGKRASCFPRCCPPRTSSSAATSTRQSCDGIQKSYADHEQSYADHDQSYGGHKQSYAGRR